MLMISRCVFDGCLYTFWSKRAELHWARAHVLLSTRRLLIISIAMLALEQVGVPVVTYIKVIAVVAFFGYWKCWVPGKCSLQCRYLLIASPK